MIELSSGTKLYNTHKKEDCWREHCPLHNPSSHNFMLLPLDYNGVNFVRVTDSGHLIVDPDDYMFHKNGYAILENSLQCYFCGDVITSESWHDFVRCSCGASFIDGGHIYIRRSPGIDRSVIQYEHE